MWLQRSGGQLLDTGTSLCRMERVNLFMHPFIHSFSMRIFIYIINGVQNPELSVPPASWCPKARCSVMLSFFYKEYNNPTSTGQVKLKASLSSLRLRTQNNEIGPRRTPKLERSVAVWWRANSESLLRARWQKQAGAGCTRPSAIRLDTLIYHRNLESLFYSVWALMLLLMQQKKERINAFWCEARVRQQKCTSSHSPSLLSLKSSRCQVHKMCFHISFTALSSGPF